MTQTPNTVKAIQAAEASLEVADELYGTSLSGNVRIRCDIRGYRTAGQARCRHDGFGKAYDFELRLHPTAVEENLEETTQNTIPHEVAHLVNYARPATGRRHNKGWKRVCLALGGDGKRCHDLELGDKEQVMAARAARRPYVYIDSKGAERRVTPQRHKAIQEGKWFKRRGCKFFSQMSYTYSDNKATISRDSEWRYEPTKIEVIASRKTTKRKVAKRDGKPSKAEICRKLIKEFYGKIHDDILIDKIAYEAGLSKGLAKTYFNNNLAKVV